MPSDIDRAANRAACPKGFSLVEMAVVLAILGVLSVFFFPIINAYLSSKNRSETLQRMKNIEAAIYNFAIVNKRLPCPANGLLTTGVETTPDASGGCTGNQLNGVVPWTTLGLGFSDIQDNWGNQVTYRIGYGLAKSSALDMSSCDAAGTSITNPTMGTPINLGLCVSTCTGTFAAANCTSPQNFLLRKGLDVSTGTVKIMDYTAYTGAAFILISHGDNGYGAINGSRIYQSAAISGTAGTTLEAPNLNQTSLLVTNVAPPQFVDTTFNDAGDATTYFDDIVIRPSLLSVIGSAQLVPRIH